MRDLERAALLSQYLQVLDDITEATRVGLETLQENAEVTRRIIQELINGVSFSAETDDLKELFPNNAFSAPSFEGTYKEGKKKEADDIDEQISKQLDDYFKNKEDTNPDDIGIYAISIEIPPDANLDDIIEKINQHMLEKGFQQEDEKKKEDEDDDLDFESLL